MHAYQVVFATNGQWSKGYTYKSESLFQLDDIVVVPTGSFYSVGKISGVKLNHEFENPDKFKNIHSKIDSQKDSMKTFTIGWVSFLDSELHMTVVKAKTITAAMSIACFELTGQNSLGLDIEALKGIASDCDGVINAVEVTCEDRS